MVLVLVDTTSMDDPSTDLTVAVLAMVVVALKQMEDLRCTCK